ncbi:aminotransferase-like domain-containing protein [Sphingomonas abietis]|uniref:PLP-dependent aminotransferase family protein n=1 Tax=Sphingomonas abietis TaxID=3012344 RepID=A0ABY7NIJ3_9SPHN|nr:PLP-dependent aminotransferase family protein [Sphingomonas abietis]WBO21340.1 PLP-dependent aminotransferase family protein [Sphingomonas abietis]
MLGQLRAGLLKPGERLPSIRQESERLGVGKNTVVEAYLRLVGQGFLQAKPGSGYFVVRSPPRALEDRPPPIVAATDRAALLTEQLERRLPIRPGDGRPPPGWLDASELKRYLSFQRFQDADAYNSAWGYLPLRERLCGALGERGIACSANQMLMTHGANHALDLIIRRYVRAGDSVLVDDPGYYPLIAKLALAGVRAVGVRRLHEGPDAQDLELKVRESGARMFFTQSLAHNPTGGSITPGNAYAVLKIATAHDLTVIEDDPFADVLPYALPRLASLDQLDRVIYVGTFSKTLAASFRVGYIAANATIASEINELKVVTTVSTSAHDERLIFELIDKGHYLKHLRRLRARASRATEETVTGLEAAGYSVRRPLGGGFYLWIDLPEHLAGAPIAESAAERGIFIAPSPTFSTTKDPKPAMRVNVAYGADPVFLDWMRELAASPAK